MAISVELICIQINSIQNIVAQAIKNWIKVPVGKIWGRIKPDFVDRRKGEECFQPGGAAMPGMSALFRPL
jgi:hypothetical protein